MTTQECAALGWETDLDFTVEQVIACNKSVLIVKLVGLERLGVSPISVHVRRIDDAALELIRKHRPPETPVGLWYPESLDGLDRIDAKHVVITSAATLDPAALAQLGPSVRTLSIYGPAFPAGSVDPSSIPHVEHLTLPWALLDAEGTLPAALRTLAFQDDAPATLSAVPSSPHLEKLELSPGRKLTTLDGLENFPGLRQFEVASARLQDISGLEGARNLEILGFDGCRGLPGLEPIAWLPHLTELALLDCGDIPSLAPLANHPGITEIVAYGTTRVADGDLTPVLSMPALRRLVLASRRAYRPNVAEVCHLRGLVAE